MMVVRAKIVQGFLLHAQAIEERNYLCDILTADLGLIRCKFLGSRPEFFRQFEIKLKQKNNFYSCSDFRYIQSLLIDQSPARLYGLYLNELAYLLLPRQIEVGLFYGTYASTLVQVQAQNNLLPNLRFYEKQLLTLLGSGIDYLRSIDGLPIEATALYSFQPGSGFHLDPNGMFLGSAILANADNSFDVKGSLAIARHCQYQQILSLLENTPLNSRDWLKLLPPAVEANR